MLIPGNGSTLSHPSYVIDQAVGLRKMLLNPRTFGEGYNVGMQQYYSDDFWVDTIGEIVGVKPEKIYMPHDVTTEVYQTFPYQIIQRHGVGLTPWYKSSLFDTRKFDDHVGYGQEHTLPAALAATYEWFCNEGLDKTFDWDFSPEDALIHRLRA